MLIVQRVSEQQDGLITAEQCRGIGLGGDDVKRLVRSRRWRVITRGVYLVDADLHSPEPSARMLLRAAYLAGGAHAVVVLDSAARLHGLQGLRAEGPVRLSLPGDRAVPKRICDARLVPHQLSIAAADIVEQDGMRVTSVPRTVADLLLFSDRFAAVSVLDSALNQGLMSDFDLPDVYRMIAGRRGAVDARQWIAESDGRAESPLETRARLRCMDGGVPPGELQAVIRNAAGLTIARADMLWAGARLIGEADGEEVHGRPEAVFRDRQRQNELVSAGYTILRFTWADTMVPDLIPATVRRALTRAGS